MTRVKAWMIIAAHLFVGLLSSLAALVLTKRRSVLLWGPVPIINNKYWSAALRDNGCNTLTLMRSYYGSINERADFDLYFDDLFPSWLRSRAVRNLLGPHVAFCYAVRHACVVHLPFTGGPLGSVPFWWRFEAQLYRLAGIRTIVIPYGGDAYLYSRIIDPSIRHVLLACYPQAAREERQISARVEYWVEKADVVICGTMFDGIGRWDVAEVQPLCIDIEAWQPKRNYSSHDGHSGPVRVLHTPNHRGFKGTEFLVQAVNELRQDGLQVELVLLEGVPNARVREMMHQVDILAEQFIAGIYAMSALEGLASGLPVIANLENEVYTRVFRRYSYLNECPIVSATPESLKAVLNALVTNPKLREVLGRAGRQYAEKYHSFEKARYLFGSIYDKLLLGRDVDLMNLFHPLRSGFNHRRPFIRHPLVDSRLPPHFFSAHRNETQLEQALRDAVGGATAAMVPLNTSAGGAEDDDVRP